MEERGRRLPADAMVPAAGLGVPPRLLSKVGARGGASRARTAIGGWIGRVSLRGSSRHASGRALRVGRGGRCEGRKDNPTTVVFGRRWRGGAAVGGWA